MSKRFEIIEKNHLINIIYNDKEFTFNQDEFLSLAMEDRYVIKSNNFLYRLIMNICFPYFIILYIISLMQGGSVQNESKRRNPLEFLRLFHYNVEKTTILSQDNMVIFELNFFERKHLLSFVNSMSYSIKENEYLYKLKMRDNKFNIFGMIDDNTNLGKVTSSLSQNIEEIGTNDWFRISEFLDRQKEKKIKNTFSWNYVITILVTIILIVLTILTVETQYFLVSFIATTLVFITTMLVNLTNFRTIELAKQINPFIKNSGIIFYSQRIIEQLPVVVIIMVGGIFLDNKLSVLTLLCFYLPVCMFTLVSLVRYLLFCYSE